MINIVSINESKENTEIKTIKTQLKFFIPLALTSALISVTHSLFNAGLARIDSPEIYIAAFQVAKGLLQVIQNPISMIRQTVSALVYDEESYYKVRRYVLGLVGIVVLFMIGFIYLGGARWTFKEIMGVNENLIDESVKIFKILLIIPIAISLRNFNQGIAIKLNKTKLFTFATIVRVLMVCIMIIFIDYLKFIPGGILAGLFFAIATLSEGISMFIGVKMSTKNLIRDIKDNSNIVKKQFEEISYKTVTMFIGPLIISAFIRSLARPIIDSGLARTITPELAISSYAVAWSLGIIIVSPVMMFHQVSLNFGDEKDSQNLKIVKKLTIYIGGILSLFVGIISFSNLGYVVLRHLIGVNVEISNLAIDVLRIMTVLPIVMIIRQYYWGLLMSKKMTKYISYGKFVNIITLFLSVTIVSLLNPKNPAIIGVIGMIFSELSEGCFLHFIYKNKDN